MAKKEKKSRPKQADLPGMEERKIPDLHKAAEEYAAVRDERMELTKEEVKLGEKVLELMHEHKKKVYRFEDVEIKVVVESEKAKVKIKKEKEPKD